VVDNLVSNAVKFSPNDGSIRIKIDNSESEVVVDVCDDGPGVPLEDQHRVFEPFYQGRKHLNGSVRGSGLGLAVAKECVEAHGGSLKLDSDTHSAGARFSFTVPAHGHA
jgi:signal transduction histidine kinase